MKHSTYFLGSESKLGSPHNLFSGVYQMLKLQFCYCDIVSIGNSNEDLTA